MKLQESSIDLLVESFLSVLHMVIRLSNQYDIKHSTEISSNVLGAESVQLILYENQFYIVETSKINNLEYVE
jgi:hypothetical protein